MIKRNLVILALGLGLAFAAAAQPSLPSHLNRRPSPPRKAQTFSSAMVVPDRLWSFSTATPKPAIPGVRSPPCSPRATPSSCRTCAASDARLVRLQVMTRRRRPRISGRSSLRSATTGRPWFRTTSASWSRTLMRRATRIKWNDSSLWTRRSRASRLGMTSCEICTVAFLVPWPRCRAPGARPRANLSGSHLECLHGRPKPAR